VSGDATVRDPVTNAAGDESFSWTTPSPWVRSLLVRNLPLRRLLPDAEPSYVSSLLYTMDVLTLASLLVVIVSGVLLAVGGVQWWHTSTLGAVRVGQVPQVPATHAGRRAGAALGWGTAPVSVTAGSPAAGGRWEGAVLVTPGLSAVLGVDDYGRRPLAVVPACWPLLSVLTLS